MNPLFTQKIGLGVRLKIDEIVGERKQEADGGGSGEREINTLAQPADMLRLSHGP